MQLSIFGVPEHQLSTCQVPCGTFSIFDALTAKEVTQAECWVYCVINENSNWRTGISHALSYAVLAKRCDMKRTAVIACINGLIEKGWLEKNVRNATERHSQNAANTYRVIHHKCEPHEVPLDKDGCPKKCAVPRGPGSPFQLVEAGTLSWKAALYWIRAKIESDWTTGVVEMTIAQAKNLIGMTAKTISAIRKALEQVGLAERTSRAFCKWTAILFPKPYEKRRKRRTENPKGMRCDGEFYYSFNEAWRVSRKDGHIERKFEGTSKWRHANAAELQSANLKIYADLKKIVDLVTSPSYRRLFESSSASLA